jgi:uncharacterized protein (TIGR00369 family)
MYRSTAPKRFKHPPKFRLKLCRRCIACCDRVLRTHRQHSSTTHDDHRRDIPEGFERQSRRSPLTDPWEPIYARQTPEAIILGLRLATPHTNARGFAHGGLIAALTDKAMGHSCGHRMRGAAQSLVTVSMAIDFISSGQIGQWLTVETDVIKTGSTLCFAQSLVKADGVVIARANGTFRVVPKQET